jgi:hypothetical protein
MKADSIKMLAGKLTGVSTRVAVAGVLAGSVPPCNTKASCRLGPFGPVWRRSPLSTPLLRAGLRSSGVRSGLLPRAPSRKVASP